MFNFSAPAVPQIQAKDLFEAIKNKEDCVILDVRTPQEFEREKIQSSINLPVDDILNKIEFVIPDKNKKIYVYCLSGSRSINAVSKILSLGYKNTFDIANGLLAWRVNKYPTI